MKTISYKQTVLSIVLLIGVIVFVSFVKIPISDTITIDYKNSVVSYYGKEKITKKELLIQAHLIDKADRRFEAKWKNKDPKGISEEYTSKNAVFMKPGKKPRIGRLEIEKEFSLSVKDVDRVEFFQDELQFFGNMDVAFQRCHMLGYVNSSPSPIFEGSYVILWKKENGTWLIEYDMFNADK
ncbi:nuclear transport factor 2 family protein [Aquimarina sp. D1M17]|uniref:YybH family protein n=1 Tax=Aquimarina acroporae TaxID=2937283 RepID=UPI0020BF5703|nr:nuclear transport factor 2 family protein [Aquimarina acroporae]MCK8520309.1 nuclear transport factor 2 family protein [Aquimarina acroporae]